MQASNSLLLCCVLASLHAGFHSLRLYCLAYHFIIQASSFRLTIQSSDPFSFPITHNHALSVYPSRVHLILHDSHIFTHSVLCSQRVPRRALLTPHSPFHFVSSHLFLFVLTECAHASTPLFAHRFPFLFFHFELFRNVVSFKQFRLRFHPRIVRPSSRTVY